MKVTVMSKKGRQFYQEKTGVTPSVVVQGDMHPSDATAHIFGVHTIAKRQSLGPVMFRLIRTGKIQKVCEVLANELAVTCRITQPDSVLSIICWLLACLQSAACDDVADLLLLLLLL